MCKKAYPLTIEFFYANKSKPTGLGTECRTCHKRAGQIRRSAKRGAFVASKGNMCESCKLQHDNHMFFDIDHIVPLYCKKTARGIRDYAIKNLQILCPNCHREKTIKDLNWGKYEQNTTV